MSDCRRRPLSRGRPSRWSATTSTNGVLPSCRAATIARAKSTAADLKAARLRFSTSAKDLEAADFHVVTVPTPIDASKQPNLEPLKSASTTIGSVLKPGDIVVYESTVYPGVTEEICIPVLESASGLDGRPTSTSAIRPNASIPATASGASTTS